MPDYILSFKNRSSVRQVWTTNAFGSQVSIPILAGKSYLFPERLSVTADAQFTVGVAADDNLATTYLDYTSNTQSWSIDNTTDFTLAASNNPPSVVLSSNLE